MVKIIFFFLLSLIMQKKISMMDVFKNPKYRGRHIVLADNKIFTAKTGEGATKILLNVKKKYPNIIPEIAYLPKAQSLILWI